MHRSGTSPITRGLKALGVELGEDLMPAAPENPTGFWEDAALYELNERLLATLGRAWYSVAPIQSEMWNLPEIQALKLEAVETVKTRFGNFPLWGFKDPRTARLLPFWKDLFKHLGIAESYVLIIRNPISVARSLKVRNLLAVEKSYLLWLQHSVEAYANTCGMPRVVVDYDVLMAHPAEQLRRIAERLALPLDPTVEDAIKDYAHGFLDDGLRHSVFEPTDVHLDIHAPDLVSNTYDLLRQVALDQLDADSKDFQSALSSARSGLVGFGPFFLHLDHLEADRDSIRRELEEVRDKSIQVTGEVVQLREAIVGIEAERKFELSARDRQNAELADRVSRADDDLLQIREKLHRTLAELETVKDQNEVLRVAAEALKSNDESLRSESEVLKPLVQLQADANAILRSELHNLWNSWSWRIFRPLRNLVRKLQGLGKETEPILHSEPHAIQTLITIRQSLSWELTAPLRLIYRMLSRRRRATAPSKPIKLVMQHLSSDIAEGRPQPRPRSVVSHRSDFHEVAQGLDSPSSPLISVIIPSYNHSMFVGHAIDSVAAQDHASIELIVIDDGSADNSISIIEESLKRASSLPSEFHTQQNQGAHAAINRGLEIARGEYLSILNSDDYYYPRRLSTLLSYMRAADKQFAFSEVDHVGPDGLKLPDTNHVRFGYLSALASLPQFPTVGFLLLLYNLTVTSGNFLLRRSLFERIGFFQPYRFVHDWEYVLRVLVETEPGFVREPLMAYRLHGGNTLAKLEKGCDLEGPQVIAHYFESVTREKASNVLAPTAYNWPRYFDWFVRNYPHDGANRLVHFVPAAMR